jgi:cytochrome c oxidase subunit 4
MSLEPVTSVRTYALVLVALVVLTFVTVGVSFIELSPGWHLTFGLLIGLVKASLVALFFMHLIHSPRLSWLIVFLALVWLLLLFALTFADYLSRGMIPYMPGH